MGRQAGQVGRQCSDDSSDSDQGDGHPGGTDQGSDDDYASEIWRQIEELDEPDADERVKAIEELLKLKFCLDGDAAACE